MKQLIFNFTQTPSICPAEPTYIAIFNQNTDQYDCYITDDTRPQPCFSIPHKHELNKEILYTIRSENGKWNLPGIFSEIELDDMSSKEYFKIISAQKSNIFEDTMAFQKKYGLWAANIKGFLPDENMEVKINHLKEELDETVEGWQNRDLAQVCDSIIDLIYVASGLLNLMNVPSQQLWNDVQLRNMCKIRATKEIIGKRGSTFDVIKPEGWVGPRTNDILSASGC